MNFGLLRKGLAEAWLLALILGLGLLVFEAAISAALASFHRDLAGPLLQNAFIRSMMQAILGASLGDNLTPFAAAAFAFAHPVALALLFTPALVLGTRVPAAEIDRGTIDMLLGLPVSRWEVYRTEGVLLVLVSVVLVALAVVGHLLGIQFAPPEYRAGPARIAAVAANLLALQLAVGALANLASACLARRGRAVGVGLAVVLGSFFMQALAQFWPPAGAVEQLCILHYYAPLQILQSESWPWQGLAVLTGVAVVTWLSGGVVLARRDLPAA